MTPVREPTSSRSGTRRPDFFVAGAPRTGTTALFESLRRHPQIFIPRRKETGFFGRDLVNDWRMSVDEYIAVFADVHVKHGSHAIVADREVAEQARDVEFFGADVLIATGSRTGDPTAVEGVEDIRAGTSRPVLIGSGLNPANAADLLRVADGAIVGSWFRTSGDMWGSVDLAKVSSLMEQVRTLR